MHHPFAIDTIIKDREYLMSYQIMEYYTDKNPIIKEQGTIRLFGEDLKRLWRVLGKPDSQDAFYLECPFNFVKNNGELEIAVEFRSSNKEIINKYLNKANIQKQI